MTRYEYLNQLRTLLRALPDDETERIVGFYEEAIADRMEAGASEADAIASLEAPGTVAARILDDLPPVPRALVRTRDRSRILFWVLAILGSPIWTALLIALAAVVLALYFVMWVLVLVAWLVSIALLAALPLGIFAAVVGFGAGHPAGALMQLGVGLACSGIGLAALRLSAWVTAGIGRAHAALTRRVASLFVRTRNDVGDTSDNADAPRHARHAVSPFTPAA